MALTNHTLPPDDVPFPRGNHRQPQDEEDASKGVVLDEQEERPTPDTNRSRHLPQDNAKDE